MAEVCKDCVHNKVCSLMEGANLFKEKIRSVIPNMTIGDLFGDDCSKITLFSLSMECASKIKVDRLKTEETK